MQKMLYFDYAAFILEIVLFSAVLMRKMYNSKLNRIFILLVTLTIFTTAADIVAVSLDNNGQGFITEKMIAHSAYLFAHTISAFYYFYYVIIMTDTWFKAANNFIKRMMIYLPLVIVTALMIINVFNSKIFYFDSNGTYTRGEWFIALYVITAYYSVWVVIKIIKYRNTINIFRSIALIVGLVLMLLSAVIQLLIPSLLVDMFASAVGLLYIFMVVQRPEEILDAGTGLNNLNSYIDDVKRSFIIGKSDTVIMVQDTNYWAVRRMLGYKDTTGLKRTIAREIMNYLLEHKLKAEVYYIGSGNFRIRIDKKYYIDAVKAAEYINEYMKNPIKYKDMLISVISRVYICSIPEDIQDFGSLKAFEDDLDSGEYTGNVLYAHDVYRKDKYDIVRHIDEIIELALTNNQFEVYYQPIYSTKQKRFNSAEALLRLKTEKYGFIPPDILIPAAEKSGAIHSIGDFVLRTVCEFISSDDFKKCGLDYIEVNLSPVQCMEKNLAKHLIDIIKEKNIDPAKLNLEITETAAAEDQDSIIDNINTLYDAGLSLSLDDFGTGYSNMQRIASLPFCIIKLDKSFARMEDNPNYIIVLENVVKMIKALNMKIVVEGIETKALVDRFSDLECEYIQGYYYCKPLPQKDLISFLIKYNNSYVSI